jgi:hypothetical protein
MNRTPIPRAEIDSVLKEISEVRFQIAKRAIDRLIETRDTLTPEQRERLYKAILRPRRPHADFHRNMQEPRDSLVQP